MDESRRNMAVKAAEGLLDELELGTGPVLSALMKGQRLARLLRDADAQAWLDLESTGYPGGFGFRHLGRAERYARAGGRVNATNHYWSQSLPQIEALQANAATLVQGYKAPPAFSPSVSSSNPNELVSMNLGSTATKLQNDFLLQRKAALDNHEQWTKILSGLKSALHSYGTDCLHSLLFGNQMEGLFEQARARVEQFVRDRAPQAAQQVVASVERFNEGEPESLSHSLTSCRRLLQTVADAVFPPSDAP